jgi:ribosome recycling factor
MFNFKEFEQKLKEIDLWLQKEFAALRTGRATVTLLDTVNIEAYGARTPLNQLASITAEDAKTLRLNIWDANVIKDIEKGIVLADLGVSVVNDGQGLRVIFPELTTERRDNLIKQAHKKLEEARISIRNERTKVLNEIQDDVKAGKLNEDDHFRLKKDVQNIIDKSQEKLEEITKQKEIEIKS